ncbi:hypothetical protein RD055328_07950 [Companilactobacillus sp. RD055328]|uniref:glycine cleavage system protein H n=1 Tax=Companilactobacillus sp. RD055328 TaxID=2916634 RepID=UPI001FC8AA4C|nr:glycine cleavage system protein H [Companilactobacillus sp. RD055328]GKQ42872.1 hypothetical protein RD055328_07950 [Companilactobacillus sp. RD055328]
MTNDSEYLKITEEDNYYTVGLQASAKEALGDVKFVDIVESNKSLNKGDMFASVEAKKAVVELEMPLDSKIIETNSDVEDNPESIYDNDTWLVKLEKK